jgi:hypothetical protein
LLAFASKEKRTGLDASLLQLLLDDDEVMRLLASEEVLTVELLLKDSEGSLQPVLL